MTDITPAINTLLTTKHSTDPVSSAPSTATADEFLKEAYRINSHISSLLHYLQSIRHSYLTTTPTLPPSQRQHRNHASTSTSNTKQEQKQQQHLTDTQRDTIDSSTALLLHDLSTSITNLSSAESLRQETQSTLLRKKYGANDTFLWRWASGGKAGGGGSTGKDDDGKSAEQRREEEIARTTRMIREAVLWFLRRGLEYVTSVQGGMVERRIERVKEKEKSVLYKSSTTAMKSPVPESPAGGVAGGGAGMVNDAAALSENEVAAIEAQLSPEQLQLFAEENDSMLRHYEDTLNKVQNAEKSLLEIASLQQTLTTHLSTQEEYITQLVIDASNTQTNIGSGNRELRRATEKRSSAQVVFWGTVGLCAGLVVWDLVF